MCQFEKCHKQIDKTLEGCHNRYISKKTKQVTKMINTVNGELTWFRILGQDWNGKTRTMEIELGKYDIGELENLGLGLGKSEKEAREVINQWLMAIGIYEPHSFWSVDFSSVTDYDCQIEISDGHYLNVNWEDDINYAKYQEIMQG